MATGQSIEGLIKWVRRDGWLEKFEDAFERHVGAACRGAGVGLDGLAEIIGDHGVSNLWGCAFEDFVSSGPDEANIAVDYLKRRGWKESAGTRAYIDALRHSTMSLYEVSGIVAGESFLARDMVRGGEPERVFERSATRTFCSRRIQRPGLGQIGQTGRVLRPPGRERIQQGLSACGDASVPLDQRAYGLAVGHSRTEVVIFRIAGTPRERTAWLETERFEQESVVLDFGHRHAAQKVSTHVMRLWLRRVVHVSPDIQVEIVCRIGDFIEGHGAGVAGDVFKSLVCRRDLLDVLGQSSFRFNIDVAQPFDWSVTWSFRFILVPWSADLSGQLLLGDVDWSHSGPFNDGCKSVSVQTSDSEELVDTPNGRRVVNCWRIETEGPAGSEVASIGKAGEGLIRFDLNTTNSALLIGIAG